MKLKNVFFVVLGLLAVLPAMSQSPIAVRWEIIENKPAERCYTSRFVITNVSFDELQPGDWQFYFNQFSRKVTLPDSAMVTVREINNGYYEVKPNERCRTIFAGDSIVIDMTMSGTFVNKSYMPQGGHMVYRGNVAKPLPVAITYGELRDRKQWIPRDDYPDGKFVFDFNKSINPNDGSIELNAVDRSCYNIFPTPKEVNLLEGTTTITHLVSIKAKWANKMGRARKLLTSMLQDRGVYVSSKQAVEIELLIDKKLHNNVEYYELTVLNGKITIKSPAEDGLINGVKTLVAAIDHSPANRIIENVSIKDYPDLPYRGYMLDIARNFTPLSKIKRFIDVISYYKINKLQFHFTDDEAWRVEIPGLPELTEVSSRRGLTYDENGFLAQVFDGNGNPNDLSQSANGFLTRAEFIDLLKYAHLSGVKVIPEIETPAHARAAIVAMKNRYNKYRDSDPLKAGQYILWDEKNTSEYTSAQSYHDNVLDVASEGTYNFLEKVITELATMYREAGIKLDVIHLGGDEVPKGAWDNSPSVKAFMQARGLTAEHQVSEYYISRMVEFLAKKNIKLEGWQEVALDHSAEFNARIAPHIAGVNAWSTVGKRDVIPYTIANSGYPVILSNVTNFYMDMGYTWHQYEQGLHWGGKVDEFASWEAQPFNIYSTTRTDYSGKPIDLATAAAGKPALEQPANIIGVQAQLFAETIRNFDQVQMLTLPKVLGLVERGWNAKPEWVGKPELFEADRAKYNLKIGSRELPLLHKQGYTFHLSQPGIKVENNLLSLNSPYNGEILRYTFDGSEPNSSSPIWTRPVAVPKGTTLIKAKAYYLGAESVTTYLWIEQPKEQPKVQSKSQGKTQLVNTKKQAKKSKK